jgi:hypothetical protein
MKYVKIVPNYLPHDLCDELNSWVRTAIAEDKIGVGITTPSDDIPWTSAIRVPSPLRYTSRMYADRFKYPELVRTLHSQIEQDFNLTKWHFPVHEHAKDATVVSATMPGGDVYLHKDPHGSYPDKEVLRCNILTEETQGGLIWVEGESYTLKKGDMMQYLVSRREHSVETVIGQPGDLRIMWMFGWHVDGDEWENSIQLTNKDNK